ncbi:MAG: hypothetical protein GVY30_04325 [Chloroflexi bacterium]|jgi:hypothetical protein|nr:hypothetical protein [Chloroflexota bacterium]
MTDSSDTPDIVERDRKLSNELTQIYKQLLEVQEELNTITEAYLYGDKEVGDLASLEFYLDVAKLVDRARDNVLVAGHKLSRKAFNRAVSEDRQKRRSSEEGNEM